MNSKHFDIDEIISNFQSLQEKDITYPEISPMEEIHKTMQKRSDQLILECGVRKGFSSSIFAYNSELSGSHCYSVDIEDCSDVVESSAWSFFQSDDTDVEKILGEFPNIEKKCIDFLLIDSLHKASHVKKVLYNWFPYLNKDSIIFVDDTDSFNYRKGQKKDSILNEINWDKINEFVINFSRSNRGQISLVQFHKKSGLSKLYKSSSKGKLPSKLNTYNRFPGVVTFIKILMKIKFW